MLKVKRLLGMQSLLKLRTLACVVVIKQGKHGGTILRHCTRHGRQCRRRRGQQRRMGVFFAVQHIDDTRTSSATNSSTSTSTSSNSSSRSSSSGKGSGKGRGWFSAPPQADTAHANGTATGHLKKKEEEEENRES
jgi:hypothetical protein